MPAAVPEPTSEANADHSEQRWKILKAHIMRERARKKQEREQEVEEERLRKEREAREQQDVMTLGETREQISQLESKLTQLKEEKHQLFLQLKKVLNEDDNRRRQLVKENAYVPTSVLRIIMFKIPEFRINGDNRTVLTVQWTLCKYAPLGTIRICRCPL